MSELSKVLMAPKIIVQGLNGVYSFKSSKHLEQPFDVQQNSHRLTILGFSLALSRFSLPVYLQKMLKFKLNCIIININLSNLLNLFSMWPEDSIHIPILFIYEKFSLHQKRVMGAQRALPSKTSSSPVTPEAISGEHEQPGGAAREIPSGAAKESGGRQSASNWAALV